VRRCEENEVSLRGEIGGLEGRLVDGVSELVRRCETVSVARLWGGALEGISVFGISELVRRCEGVSRMRGEIERFFWAGELGVLLSEGKREGNDMLGEEADFSSTCALTGVKALLGSGFSC
jgi:hypothetical protein